MAYLLRDGYVYWMPKEYKARDKYYVKHDDYIIGFQEASPELIWDSIKNILQPASKSRSGWELHCAEGDKVTFGFDMSPEWVMDREPTFFIECDPNPVAFRLSAQTISGSSRYRVRAGTSYKLSAYTACHRCRAKLEWHCYDQGGTLILSHDLPLPLAKGGANAKDYAQVALTIKVPDDAFEAEVSVTYEAAVEPIAGFRSFIFLSALTLVPLETPAARDLASTHFGLSDEEANGAQLYRAPIDVGHLSSFDLPIKIMSSAGSEIETITLDARPMRSAQISIEHVGGTRLKASGSLDDGMLLFIDGKRVGSSDFYVADDARSEFEISSGFCDGNYHKVELRDRTGCYRYGEAFVLLPYQQTPWAVLQEHSGFSPPEHLSPAAGQRYKSLVAHLKAGGSNRATVGPAQIEHAHSVLLKGFKHNKCFDGLAFVEHEAPRVSIVIPLHNKFEVTYFCLCALLFSYVEATFEVILVDDGSSDRTIELPKLVRNIGYVRNDVSLGFVRACNKGAKVARGEYIVFLNNDTEPAYRWLDELTASFNIFRNVGLAGSKLVYPDGRLQEAGGIVWKSGNPWNYGRLANPFDPRFSYTRDVDYLSGAAIMVPATLWKSLGGFSDEFAPAYFEDTDLAFKVRAAGYRTLLVATSVVYHFEGVTSGIDVMAGAKRHQEINRPIFKRKWRNAFRNHGEEGDQPDLEKDRGIIARALFLDYATPRADMDAGSHAAIQEMLLFQHLGYKVTFFPQNAAYLGDYFTALQRRGIEMLHAPFFTSFEEILRQRGNEFHVVYITRYYVAREAINLIRRHAPQSKILFCNADLHFLRLLRSAAAQNDEAKIAEAVRVREEELDIMRRVDLVLSYNDVEHAVILSHNLTSSRVMKLPWVETIREAKKNFDEREGVSFLGSFNHYPNVEAVEYFATRVMPYAASKLNGLRFHVFGSNLPEHLRKLASSNIVMHGFVEDLDEVFATRKVFVAPLLSGAGIKGKVLSALSYGIPCILSPMAAEGIGVRHRFDCMLAETPEQWVSALEELLGDARLWRTIGGNGQVLVQTMFSEERGIDMMRNILETMDLPVN